MLKKVLFAPTQQHVGGTKDEKTIKEKKYSETPVAAVVHSPPSKSVWKILPSILAISAAVACGSPRVKDFLSSKTIAEFFYSLKEQASSRGGSSGDYSCPAEISKADNDVGDYFDYYEHWKNDFDEHGLDMFRERAFGGRGQTYNWLKEKATNYKAKYFGDHLKSGDWIYESGCGEGLSLLMTIEILFEQRGIKDLVAFGNDYLPESVSIANQLFERISDATPWISKGKICRGDSTKLDFVPSSTFDLVYTGVIDPIIDPLRLLPPSMELEEKIEWSRERCMSDDPDVIDILHREQSAQEDWHSAWVKEMLRIVKPGKVVIIEDVLFPICHESSEFGGIAPEWWKDAVSRYGWDVDADSIVIEQAPAWSQDRYNVFLRRRNSSS